MLSAKKTFSKNLKISFSHFQDFIFLLNKIEWAYLHTRYNFVAKFMNENMKLMVSYLTLKNHRHTL